MNRAARAYYKGGHRVMLGGVPCRVARLPQHEGGKRAMRESSREMCLPLPPRGRKEFAQWERQQREAYDAAPKLGPWIAPEPVAVEVVAVEPEALAITPVEPVEAVSAVGEPVRPLRVDPSRYARPAGRRPAMSGAMRTVNYYRVSTAKQGQSGLGLEAQRAAVATFCADRGCEVLGEYVEVESGKRDDRPQLVAALRHAKMTGATVVIAKLDRLSRNVAFLAQLQDAGVKFIAADMPEANEMVVGMMAVMAQAERKAISARTKAALGAAKARGTRLGNPLGVEAFGNSTARGRVAGVAVIKDNAQSFAEEIRPIIDAIRATGHTSIGAIADELNARQIMTARRGKWSKSTVHSVLKRTAGLN